ncbi:MAG: hypothetical protein D6722_23985 [Bacteroidetes bacterium]|nr:MAG: hypothetical protein D6722_23985 [Bacteroidota bacterium]
MAEAPAASPSARPEARPPAEDPFDTLLSGHLEAAERHFKAFAFVECAHMAGKAMTLLEALPPNNQSAEQELAVRLLKARADIALEHYDAVIADLQVDRPALKGSFEARRLLSQALRLGQQSQQAASLIPDLFELAKGSPAQRAEAHLEVGQVHFACDNYEAATQELSKAEALFDALEDTRGLAQVYKSQGRIYRIMGQSEQAITLTRKALAQFEALADKVEISNACYNLSIDFLLDGTEALAYAQRALDIDKSLGVEGRIASSLSQLGTIKQVHGDLEAANAYYEEAEDILARIQDWGTRAEIMQSRVLILQGQEEYAAALELNQAVLNYYEENDQQRSVVVSLVIASQLWQAQDNSQQAFQILWRALALTRKLGNPSNECWILTELMDLCLHTGDLAQAEAYLRKGEPLLAAFDEAITRANFLRSAGHVRWAKGQYQRALPYYEQCLGFYEENGYTYEADEVRERIAEVRGEAGMRAGSHQPPPGGHPPVG